MPSTQCLQVHSTACGGKRFKQMCACTSSPSARNMNRPVMMASFLSQPCEWSGKTDPGSSPIYFSSVHRYTSIPTNATLDMCDTAYSRGHSPYVRGGRANPSKRCMLECFPKPCTGAYGNCFCTLRKALPNLQILYFSDSFWCLCQDSECNTCSQLDLPKIFSQP